MVNSIACMGTLVSECKYMRSYSNDQQWDSFNKYRETHTLTETGSKTTFSFVAASLLLTSSRISCYFNLRFFQRWWEWMLRTARTTISRFSCVFLSFSLIHSIYGLGCVCLVVFETFKRERQREGERVQWHFDLPVVLVTHDSNSNNSTFDSDKFTFGFGFGFWMLYVRHSHPKYLLKRKK